MVAEADAGDIVGQERIAIEPEDTALTLYRKVEAAGPALLARLLVAAGEGAVLLTAVQAVGGPEMQADSWAGAVGFHPGRRLPGAS
jgi:methionyl-tRNA formyltransferase